MRTVLQSLLKPWKRCACELSALGGLPKVQARERYVPDWIKGEGLTVPCDHVPLRRHPNLTRCTVPNKVAGPDSAAV